MKPLHTAFQKDFDGRAHNHPGYAQLHPELKAPASWLGSVLSLLLLTIVLGYQLLYKLGYDLLPFDQIIWNIVVFLTPRALVAMFEPGRLPGLDASSLFSPEAQAAKGAAMRRILGVDRPGSVLHNLADVGRRGLSNVPMVGRPQVTAGKGPPGLGNWDNSCYQNSVLQGLSSLDPLRNYLRDPLRRTNTDDGEDTVQTASSQPKLPDTPAKLVDRTRGAIDGQGPSMHTITALRDLIEDLNSASNVGSRFWTPPALKSMSSWQQQDAQEYYSRVLDEVDKEVSKARKQMKDKMAFKTTGLGDDQGKLTASSGTSTSTLRNPLEGSIAQRVGCMTCGYSEGLSIVPFNCLTVPLRSIPEQHLFECLDECTKLELIEGVECAKCTLLKHQNLLRTLWERVKELSANHKARVDTARRLQAIDAALEDEEFDEKTLSQKCSVSSKTRSTATKSRQAVIACPPQSLTIHINRSLFDEVTGDLHKNYSRVQFPRILDLGRWCLGSTESDMDVNAEGWKTRPCESMLSKTAGESRQRGPFYEIRSLVTHSGRHENGHYICYKSRRPLFKDEDVGSPSKEEWWRLSDDDVDEVDEREMLNQGGVFMLFYDRIEPAEFIERDIAAETYVATLGELADTSCAASRSLPAESDPEFCSPPPSYTQAQWSLPDSAMSASHTTSSEPLPSMPPSTPPGDVESSELSRRTRLPFVVDSTLNTSTEWQPESSGDEQSDDETIIATTPNETEVGEESSAQHPTSQDEYRPTRAVFVAPYMAARGPVMRREDDDTEMTSPSMVMV